MLLEDNPGILVIEKERINSMETDTRMAFTGSDEDKKLASHAFEAMKRKGMLFAANAPIRMSLEAIAKALTKEGGPMAGDKMDALTPKLQAALAKNKATFAKADNGEFITTKAGHAYRMDGDSNTHTFKERLNAEATNMGVEAAKEYEDSLMNRAAQRADRINIPDIVTEMRPFNIAPPVSHGPHITFENTTVIPQHLIQTLPPMEQPKHEEPKAPPPPPTRLSLDTPIAPPPPLPPPVSTMAPMAAPSALSTHEARPAQPPAPSKEAEATEVVQAKTIAEPEAAAEAPVQEAAPVAGAAAPQLAAPAPAAPAPAKPAERKEPTAPVITGPVEMRVPTADGFVTIDLRDSVDDIMTNQAVANALTEIMSASVEEHAAIVRFGSDVFPEEAIERFSKGDFRRIKDFLDEPDTGGVASDHDFIGYVFNRRPEQPDYEKMRFSLNYRLFKEKKDFEFVGIDSNRLWMNAGAFPVAPTKRKPAEIGQDYRFLEDPAIGWAEDEEEVGTPIAVPSPLDYVLTNYEYENGVLPYDRFAKRLFKGPVFEDQRASLIQFEIPQLYASVLAELRYPTGNRGGFIMGLSDFFTEHLVPGAKFTVVPTDRAENIMEIQYVKDAEREENLLQFDDRKGRYVFRPVSFAAGVDPSSLLAQEKFGKLHNQKKLEEAERKRADVIITSAFEAVGESIDGKYWAILDDVFPVVNLERPISRSWLKTLMSGAYPFFYADESTEGFYFYDPAKRPA